MRQPHVEFTPVEIPGEDPRWGVAINHLEQLNQCGVPDGMIHVGSMVMSRTVHDRVEEYRAPALLAGVGERHVAFQEQTIDESVIAARTFVLGLLESKPAGTVKLSVYDGPLTGQLGEFAALGKDLYERIEPSGLSSFLDQLTDRHSRLGDSSNPIGTAAEPWQLSVIVGHDNMRPDDLAKLDRLIAAGPKYGNIITAHVPVQGSEWLRRGWPYPVCYTNPDNIADRCQKIAETSLGAASPDLDAVLTGEMWTKTAHNGLELSPGIGPDGKPYHIVIGSETEHPPHILLTGPSGTGKTVLEKSLILSLAHHYPPSEAQVMLLDFKEGTEFSVFAPNGRDPAFLPNATAVGTNMNNDPEFGIAALKHLETEVQRRGARAREVGASKYVELREKDPAGEWPRILLVMDEFQFLLNSPLGKEAVELLDDIARRGRSFGIHLLLTTQDVQGISALYDKSLFSNFSYRIAMKHGTVLKPENTAPNTLPDRHALVNKESGEPWANVVVKVPNAASQELIDPYVQTYYEQWQQQRTSHHQPRLFDGSISPELYDLKEFERLKPVDLDPRAILAEKISVTGGTAELLMSRDPAHNLAVIGQRRVEANRVLHAAAVSLAKQQRPADAEFSLVCLDRQSTDAVNETAAALRDQGHMVRVVSATKAPRFFSNVQAGLDPESDRSHYITVFGADASRAIMNQPLHIDHPIIIGDRELRVEPGAQVSAHLTTIAAVKENYADTRKIVAPVSGQVEVHDNGQVVIVEKGKSGVLHLRDLLNNGPEHGVHILASFSGVKGLQEVATDVGKPASIGAYVAFGIPQHELGALTPDLPYEIGQAVDVGRAERGVFYNRFLNRPPTVVVPFTASREDYPEHTLRVM